MHHQLFYYTCFLVHLLSCSKPLIQLGVEMNMMLEIVIHRSLLEQLVS